MLNPIALQIFERALELAADQRQPLIDTCCGDDTKLLHDVQKLMTAYHNSAGFMEPKAERGAPAQIGHYRMLRCIGLGGMGQVWLAERDDGAFQQQVAIKLLHSSFADPVARQRAVAERQFLARLSHPNIARILDAGTSDAGQMYVVMEYVDGVPILDYAREQSLDLRTRLRLFLAVLDAIDEAHRALIIHRDLKSANVLVTQSGVAKLLDFGIAKSLDADSIHQTQTGMVMLTPSAASPEQIEGKNLTVTSDIYSAGLLLYQLLTGHLPREIEGSLIDHARALANAPIPPATGRVSQAALSAAAIDVQLWKRSLRGDLEAILAKALRYEPSLRYRTAREFADDIERWMAQRPVLARSGGRWYTWKKFIARNRLTVTAASVGLIAMSAGLVLAWNQQQEKIAEAERARLSSEFLGDLIATADPWGETGTLTMVDALDRASGEIGARFAKQPLLESDIRATIGDAYYQLNRLDSAQAHLKRVYQIESELAEPRVIALANCLNLLAQIEWSKGELNKAEQLFLRAKQDLRDGEPEQRRLLIDIDASLSDLVIDLGRTADGIAIAMQNDRRWQDDPSEAKRSVEQKATLLSKLGYAVSADPKRIEEAVNYYRQARVQYLKIYPVDHLFIAVSLNNEAMALLELKRELAAAELLTRSLAIRRKHLKPGHWMRVMGASNLAGLRAQLGEHAVACSLIQDAFVDAKSALEPKDPTWARILSTAASVAQKRGDKGHAIEYAEHAMVLVQSQDGSDPTRIASINKTLTLARSMPNNPNARTCDLDWQVAKE